MDTALEHEVLARVPGEGRDWLIRALADHDLGRLSTSFTVCPRFVPGGAPSDRIAAPASLGWLLDGAPNDELARVTILVYAASLTRSPAELALEWYRTGDNREKRAVVRALSLLPAPGKHVPLGVQACRTNVGTVFEGLCCENPFPAAELPDWSFNHMVLKALFTGVAVDRITGLQRRRNPSLARMAADYASERLAAGRPVPSDLARVLDAMDAPARGAGEIK